MTTRLVERDDLPRLFGLASQLGALWHRLGEDRPPEYHEFETKLWERCAAVFIHTVDARFACSSLFDLDVQNGTVWIDTVEPRSSRGRLLEAAVTRTRCYAERVWRLRKLYFVGDESTTEHLARGDRRWICEARLCSYDFWDDRFHDRIVLASFLQDERR